MSINSGKPLSNIIKGGSFFIFFSTGFSALIFQIVWQRVLTIHAGIDLYSVTTVVAAFMAGLGLGSLLGGYIADRLTFRNCFVLFFISNCVIGVFGFFSLWLFYDVYSGLIFYLTSTVSSFLFHFLLLCIPTFFMGLSLPLLSKALVRTSDEMSSLVGALYGINTLGAAVGAGLGTWYMLGTFGFITCIKIASSINIVCGLLVIILLSRLRSEALVPIESGPIPRSDSSYINSPEEEWILVKKPGFWILIYGLTGFAALSLEIVWFRLLAIMTKSTSYVFGHLLFIYLCGFGIGCLVSSRIVKRVKRPDKLFLWMQYLIGLLSLLSPFILISLPKSWEVTDFMINFFQTYPYPFRGFKDFRTYFFTFNFLAFFIFGLSTIFMGICFPLVQRIVSRQMKTLGRNLSKLLFSNILGNILGSLITGFFLMDYLGTPATLKFLGALLIIPGIVAGYSYKGYSRRFFSVTLIILTSLTLLIVFPKEKIFWSFFHGFKLKNASFVEDRTSISALIKGKNYAGVYVNGTSHSGIPFGGIHSMLGIAPALYHPNPKTSLVIGFGSGDTAYSTALDKRLEKIKILEISRAQIKQMKMESKSELLWQVAKVFQDPRIQVTLGDARKFLLHTKEKFDIIEVDALRPFTAYSGNIYSVEFFELIKQRLRPGGIFAQWIPRSRVKRSVLKVFPYVIRFRSFVLASNEPIKFNKFEIIERLKTLNLIRSHGTKNGKFLTDFFAKNLPVEIQAGNITEYLDEELNLDLFPKDEYFLNNKWSIDSKRNER